MGQHHRYIKEFKCAYEFAAFPNLQDFTIATNEEARPAGKHSRTHKRPQSKEVVLMPIEHTGHRDIAVN